MGKEEIITRCSTGSVDSVLVVIIYYLFKTIIEKNYLCLEKELPPSL